MNLLKKMENNETFSQSELIVRNYVLNQKENILNKTVNEIASENYVSKSTLTRFSQKLGFSGWNEFKIAFFREIGNEKNKISDVDVNFPFTVDDSPEFITKKLLVMKQNILEQTFQLLDTRTLNNAVSLLTHKNRIHIFAEGYSLSASNDFCYRMSRIGKHITNDNQIGMSYIAESLTSDDLAFIVSYSGRTKDVVYVTSILKQHNVPVISITSDENNPISELADIDISIPTMEDLYFKISNYSTVDSIRFVFDILFSLYFNGNFNVNLKNRTSMARVVDKKQDI